jgi:ubiquinone/menaquinone biosynthesis C-methylase UbiE
MRGVLIMAKFILDEIQLDRDKELATLLNLSLEEVQKLPIAAPDSIRISNGDKPDNLEDLYHDYEHLNFPAYLRTLMFTSVTRRHSELFNLLRTTKGKVCLDFGSGCGSHSIALLQNGNYVDLLDVPGKLPDFASKRIEARLLENNARVISNKYNLTSNTYQVVICSDCLEHVSSPLRELKRIHASMKKGGVMHLLVSEMRKVSSGHFDSSIDEWINYGKKFVKENFICVKPSIYIKK